MSQRNVYYIVFSSRHRAQIDCTSSQTEHFHCWRQTLPLRRVLFHPASEKEIVRDVTEKRLLHRVFIATQSPCRRPLLPMCDKETSQETLNPRRHLALEANSEATWLDVGVQTCLVCGCCSSLVSASSVEMMEFTKIHLMSHTNRVRETYNEHARRCLVSPTLETTSPACYRFSTCGFSVRCSTASVAMISPSASRLSSSH